MITGGIRSVSDVDFYKFTLHSQADVQLDLYKLHPDRYRFAGDRIWSWLISLVPGLSYQTEAADLPNVLKRRWMPGRILLGFILMIPVALG